MATRAFSIEEGNTQVRSVSTARRVDYSDLDLSFTLNSIKDVYKKKDAAAVKQSVKTLILTNYGEKPFQPLFGTNIRSMLFELFDYGVSLDVERRVKSAIQNFEPRARIRDIQVKPNPDNNLLDIEIVFQVVNSTEIVTLNTTISRIR